LRMVNLKLINSAGVELKDEKLGNIFIFCIAAMSILLHQARVMFGVNISLSDFFCVIVLICFIFKYKLFLPFKYFFFFLVVSFIVTFVAVSYVPVRFNYVADYRKVFSDFIKIIAVFLYFVVGYNMSRLRLTDFTLKYYSFFALFIGIIGVLFDFLNITLFSKILFYGNVRLKGLMNDPNYFSILQITALAYFLRNVFLNRFKKIIIIIAFLLSVLASGSKTGFIALLCYLIFVAMEELLRRPALRLTSLAICMVSFVALFLLVPYLISGLTFLSVYISQNIPAFSRIESLFLDFSKAISEGGSGRDIAWGISIDLLKLSPVLGIGIGTYVGLAKKLYGVGVIAHNTFLQLYTEWGIVLATLLFVHVFFMIAKSTFNRMCNIDKENIILRDIIIIFLLGSVGISLNNARMFWLALGALVFNLNKK